MTHQYVWHYPTIWHDEIICDVTRAHSLTQVCVNADFSRSLCSRTRCVSLPSLPLAFSLCLFLARTPLPPCFPSSMLPSLPPPDPFLFTDVSKDQRKEWRWKVPSLSLSLSLAPCLSLCIAVRLPVYLSFSIYIYIYIYIYTYTYMYVDIYVYIYTYIYIYVYIYKHIHV